MQPAPALARSCTLLSIVVATAFQIACGNDPVIPNSTAVDSVVVAPRTATLAVGSSVSLTAAVLDNNGEPLSMNVSWTSEDTTIARVSQSGVVTALSTGIVRVAASSWGKNDVATITVNPAVTMFPRVGRIVIGPANPRVTEGQTIQLTATVLDVEERTISGIEVTWSSSNTSRATVDQTGLVRGINDGNATITASAGGKTGSISVRIDR